MHAPLHAPSDPSAVSHFVAPLTDMRTKAEARLQRQKLSTVRQMWEQGCSYDDVEQNLLSMVMDSPVGMSTPMSDEEAE